MIKQRVETDPRVQRLNELHVVDKETMDMIRRRKLTPELRKELN